MLKLENVNFAYDKDPVLDNVSFTLEKGQNISIIGQSGCGKSTLFSQKCQNSKSSRHYNFLGVWT